MIRLISFVCWRVVCKILIEFVFFSVCVCEWETESACTRVRVSACVCVCVEEESEKKSERVLICVSGNSASTTRVSIIHKHMSTQQTQLHTIPYREACLFKCVLIFLLKVYIPWRVLVHQDQYSSTISAQRAAPSVTIIRKWLELCAFTLTEEILVKKKVILNP